VPSVSISVAQTLVEVGETLGLSNTGSPADRYEWKLPDGTVVTTRDLITSFSAPGTYTIQLTAFNKDDQSATTSITLQAGYRMLKEVRVTKMNFLTPAGVPWDATDGTGPDVSFSLGDGGKVAEGAIIKDVTPSQLPLVWDMTSASIRIIPALSKMWSLSLQEEDAKGPSFFRSMFLHDIVVGIATSSYRDKQGISTTTVSSWDGNWSVTITYDIR
jgi:hypothetical protein